MSKLICTVFILFFIVHDATAEIFYLDLIRDEIKIGKYDNQLRKKELKSIKLEDLAEGEVFQLIGSTGNDRILYYFHSLYGNFRPYHKNSIKKLNQINGFDKVIAVEWHAEAVRYTKAWEQAFGQGQRLGPLMNQLLSRNVNSVLCHSMGNRVFEGVLAQLTGPVRIKKLVLAAPDLDLNCYAHGADLHKLDSCEVLILVNEKDKILKLSRRAHHRKRLGLHGDEADAIKIIKAQSGVQVVNVTKTLQGQLFSSGHIYFKRNKKVFGQIKTYLERI